MEVKLPITAEVQCTYLEHIRTKMEIHFAIEPNRLRGELSLDVITNRIVSRFEYDFLGKHMPTKRINHTQEVEFGTIELPADWWQAFKKTYAESWWMKPVLRLWPVKTCTINPKKQVTFSPLVAFDVLYPDFAVPESMGRVIKIPIVKDPITDVYDMPAPNRPDLRPLGTEYMKVDQYIEWCKKSALRLLPLAGPKEALESFLSNMERDAMAKGLIPRNLYSVGGFPRSDDREAVKSFITNFW